MNFMVGILYTLRNFIAILVIMYRLTKYAPFLFQTTYTSERLDKIYIQEIVYYIGYLFLSFYTELINIHLNSKSLCRRR